MHSGIGQREPIEQLHNLWYSKSDTRLVSYDGFHKCHFHTDLTLCKGNARHNWHCIGHSKYQIFTQETRCYQIPVCYQYYPWVHTDYTSDIVSAISIVRCAFPQG